MKEFTKEFREGWTNLALNIRDYFTWIFNYKKLNEDWKDETKQHLLSELEFNRKIEKLNKEKELMQNEKDHLIELSHQKNQELNSQIGKLIRNLSSCEKEVVELKNKLEEKEKSRRSSASKVGALQGYTNRLEFELKLANDKINFLKNNRKSPTLEELKAYEYSRKEVLKRQNKRSN